MMTDALSEQLPGLRCDAPAVGDVLAQRVDDPDDLNDAGPAGAHPAVRPAVRHHGDGDSRRV